jgi:hypothetical protein
VMLKDKIVLEEESSGQVRCEFVVPKVDEGQ